MDSIPLKAASLEEGVQGVLERTIRKRRDVEAGTRLESHLVEGAADEDEVYSCPESSRFRLGAGGTIDFDATGEGSGRRFTVPPELCALFSGSEEESISSDWAAERGFETSDAATAAASWCSAGERS